MSRYSEYTPDTSARDDYPLATASEVNDLVKQRAELKAELKARLKIERAAHKQSIAQETAAAAGEEEEEEEEEGELLDDQDNINIQNQSDVSDSRSQVEEAPRPKIPVYKDSVTPSSLKRKADGEEDALEAKRQRKATSEELTDFGVKTSKHLYCASCQFSKDEDPVEYLSMNIVLPRNGGISSLADRLMSTGEGQLLNNCQCLSGKCDKRNRTIERYEVEQTSKYLIVQAPRVGDEMDSEGNVIVDDNGDTISAKIHEKIEFPRDIIDLSPLMPENKQTEGTQYELFGMVMHSGDNHYDGHFMALGKVGQQWFECNDEKVTAVADEDLADYDNGQLFFLRRIN